MEPEAFHQLLAILQQTKDPQVRSETESIYFAFRSQTPSDNFIQLLFNECVTASDVQVYAQVLFRQDIEKLDEQCGLNRLSNKELGRQLMIELLHYSSTAPSHYIVAIIAGYAVNEINQLKPFPEIFDFIQQAFIHEDERVRQMALQITAELCLGDTKHFPFDVLEFLQKALNDTCDQVAQYTIEALQRIIEYDTEIDEPQIPDQVICQIVLSVLNRVAQTMTNGRYEVAEKQLMSISEIIDSTGSMVINELPAIISLLEQILLADVTEPLKSKAIHIFSTICTQCDNIRKYLQEIIQGFVRKCVIPNLVMSDIDLQNWLTTEKDYEYEDNSLPAMCEDCIENVAGALGKQVIFPLVMEVLTQAQQSNDWRVITAALRSVKYSAENINDVVKQKDVELFANSVIQFLHHENPRVRFDAIDTLAVLGDDFKPMIQKYHKIILPALFEMVDDPNPKVNAHVPIAILDYTQYMSYETTYTYVEQLFEIIKHYFKGDIKMQIGSLLLTASLTETIDIEDITPLLMEFMPLVFSQFESIMQAMHEVTEFTKDQTDFVNSVMDCIQAAADSVPDLFEEYIDMIVDNFIFIAKRSAQNKEFDTFEQSMKCISKMTEKFKAKTEKFIDPLFPIFFEVLNLDSVSYSTKPDDEAEPDYDHNVSVMHTMLLDILSDFMQKYPQLYGQHFTDVFETIRDFKHQNLDQLVARLECLASLVFVADACNLEFNEVHENIFPMILKQIVLEDDETQIYSFSLVQISDQGDAMETYIKAYVRHVAKTGDMSTYEVTMTKFFSTLTFIYKNALAALKRSFQEVEENSEYDSEEREAEFTRLVDDYDGAIDSIAAAYSTFILEFTDKIPMEVVAKIIEIVKIMMENGVESDPGVIQTMQGIALCSDLAEFTTAEICMQVFPDLYPSLIKIIGEKPDEWQLLQVIYYGLGCFLKKSNCVEAAGNADLLMAAVGLLDTAKESGSEDALNCYDNICGYMIVSGSLTQQPASYWSSLIRYCKQMESDQEEIANCIIFFMKELQSNPTIKQLKSEVADLIIRLFFGQFYSVFRNEPSNAETVAWIHQMLTGMKKQADNIIRGGNEFMKKNYKAFLGK